MGVFPPSIKIRGSIIEPPPRVPSTFSQVQKQLEGESQRMETSIEYTLNPMRSIQSSTSSNVQVNTSVPTSMTPTLSNQAHMTQQDPFFSPSITFPPGIVTNPLPLDLQQQSGPGAGTSSLSLPRPTNTTSNVTSEPRKKPFAWGNPNNINVNPVSVKGFAQIQQEEIEARKNATVENNVNDK